MTDANTPDESTGTDDPRFETERVLSRAERDSLDQLIGIALANLIDRDYSRQAAIDALSIAQVLVAESNPDGYGIAPGNVPEHALPPSYDASEEEI